MRVPICLGYLPGRYNAPWSVGGRSGGEMVEAVCNGAGDLPFDVLNGLGALVERAEPELAGPQQGAWLARPEEEHDNLRAAWAWSKERGERELEWRAEGMDAAWGVVGGLFGEEGADVGGLDVLAALDTVLLEPGGELVKTLLVEVDGLGAAAGGLHVQEEIAEVQVEVSSSENFKNQRLWFWACHNAPFVGSVLRRERHIWETELEHGVPLAGVP